MNEFAHTGPAELFRTGKCLFEHVNYQVCLSSSSFRAQALQGVHSKYVTRSLKLVAPIELPRVCSEPCWRFRPGMRCDLLGLPGRRPEKGWLFWWGADLEERSMSGPCLRHLLHQCSMSPQPLVLPREWQVGWRQEGPLQLRRPKTIKLLFLHCDSLWGRHCFEYQPPTGKRHFFERAEDNVRWTDGLYIRC